MSHIVTFKKIKEIDKPLSFRSSGNLKLKFRGVTEFKLGEMLSIKRKVFANETLDYLFTTEEE